MSLYQEKRKSDKYIQGPLLDRLAVDIYETQRDDILLPNASIPRHIYRLPPSPEVDAAWEALSHNGLIAVSEDEVQRAGKDPTLALKIPEDWGYEPNMYLALLDGVHQVHCLNMIRKSLVNNYEYYYGQQYNFTPPIFTQAHVNHCLDSLLQDLMCYADSHITLFNWVDGQAGAQPDFAVNRVCRDYNTLMQWFDDNQIPDWQAKAKHLHRQPFDKARPRFAGWNEYVNGILAGYDGDVPLGTMSGLPPSCTAT